MEPTGENRSKCAKDSGQSDENLELFCNPCQTENEHVPAKGYCIECHEYLCKGCHRAHRRLAATKGHTVQQNEHMPSQRPERDLKSDTCIPEMCPVHADQPTDYYCTYHEDICCVVCKSKRHANCSEVKTISDMLDYVDIEQEYSNLKGKMKDLVDVVDYTQEQVEISLNVIELNYEVAQTSKCEMRKAVNDHLDKIECVLDEKLNSMSQKDLKRIVSYSNKCHATRFDINAMELYMRRKMKSNKYQFFVAMKKAEIILKSNHEDLVKLRCNNNFRVNRYNFQPQYAIVNLKTAARSFGNIVVKENAVKSVKQLVVLNTKSENNESCLISGLVLLSRDHLVAVDNKNKSVKMINIDEDRIVSEITLESAPWDAVALNDTQIVVTVTEAKMLTFFTVNENKCLDILKEKQIHVSGRCYGVTSVDEKLIVCMNNPAKLETYNYNGKLLFSLNVNAKEPQYVTLNTGKTMLYMSGKANGCCIQEFSIEDGCYSMTRTFAHGNDRVLGTAVDKTGCLYYCDTINTSGLDYVCNAIDHTIYTISVDDEVNRDETSTPLIEQVSNPPQCLAYCNDTNRLFVGMDGDCVVVYYVV